MCVGIQDLVMYSWLAWHLDCRAVHLKFIVICLSALCPQQILGLQMCCIYYAWKTVFIDVQRIIFFLILENQYHQC